MVAPDEGTFAYLAKRPYSPKERAWDTAVAGWRSLASDPEAAFDTEVLLDAQEIAPMVTWGNSPQDAAPITARTPDPAAAPTAERRDAIARALAYMDLAPGMRLEDIAIDRVFIGSCTNGRIEDLRVAASILRGRKVAPGVEAWIVPGSGLVKAAAESEGLDRIFTSAGFQWRHAGCSMCLGTNGEIVAPNERCASTTNRNFVGRQGPGSRTHLMSPAMAAAAAVAGHLIDVRRLMAGD
jgi:3-isopropylmalate/(R)-2-methylmalate dehydratase large subunit